MAERAQIIVKGVVQGVGFRPYVYNLAENLGLAGYVTNTADGVLIEIEGNHLAEFIQKLKTEAPPLSRITDISIDRLPPSGYTEFSIRRSLDEGKDRPFTLVSPDVSICPDCLAEMLDPSDRRYLYPFINCTNCGPRYTITKSVPYDRPQTTMGAFTMCRECEQEYHDPKNRRFHAQPNACPVCGPQVEIKVQSSGFNLRKNEPIRTAFEMLRQGGIVAIKGLGGFHIACDAMNDAAVKKLRERKRKSNKPFAVMSPDVDSIAAYAEISDFEKNLLVTNVRPIVLLTKKGNQTISEAVSPNNQYIGVMLPYTPLHYLLFTYPTDSAKSPSARNFLALVMTSGNLAEEPIVRDNDEAVRKLSPLVDGFLFHNRDIFMGVDDSVVRVQDNSEPGASSTELSFIRRSRGHAPEPITLQDDGPEVLGCGADLKNTFTLTKGGFAIPSQHIGDMENYETLKFYEECLENLKSVYRVRPVAIVHDLHPGYLSTRWAKEQESRGTARDEVRLFGIQHHYAHIGSVMAEHGIKEKVIGVTLDGTGYGTDGNLWGGEFLIADINDFERVGQYKYIRIPGGEAAIREPWRTAISYVMDAFSDKAYDYLVRTGFAEKHDGDSIRQVMTVAGSAELSPLASGAGRLFDAVSALLGVCDRNTFEGEAAMSLEAIIREGVEGEYDVELKEENGYTVMNFSPVIQAVVQETIQGQDIGTISAKFHNTIASATITLAGKLCTRTGIKAIALSGGTFQNQYLLNRVSRLLRAEGMKVYVNRQVPCNDACISLGQAYLVRERLKKC